ncbi:hypothetical protein HOY80DRAFT_411173 [Tuber brumale]|nr:hypothetical protein HOY80DRAFT_411173 [Tuber brumale]
MYSTLRQEMFIIGHIPAMISYWRGKYRYKDFIKGTTGKFPVQAWSWLVASYNKSDLSAGGGAQLHFLCCLLKVWRFGAIFVLAGLVFFTAAPISLLLKYDSLLGKELMLLD